MADIRNLSFDDLPSAQPANAGLTFADLPDASPTVLEQLGRQLGLTARAGIGGIAAIPNMIADPATALVNKAFGTALPIPSQALDRTLSRFLPQPQNATERIAQAGAQAMVPTAASVQLGRVVPALAQLAQYPATQFVSAASGGASSEGAKELGAGPVGQGVAGLAGGIVAPAALLANATAVRSAARVPGAFMAPLTENGRMNTASRALQRAAFGPRAAADNIDNAISYVPGVMPTTAEVANDPGISAIYKTMRNQNPAVFAARDQANDASRQAFLNQIFGNQTDLEAAKSARETVTTPLREQALSAANNTGQQILGLENGIAQKAASKAQALQQFGQMATGAAEQNTFANNFVPVPGMPRVPSVLSPNLENVPRYQAGAQDAAKIAAQRQAEMAALQQQRAAIPYTPLRSEPILQSIQSTLNVPGIRASDVASKTLADIQGKLATLTDANGLIDARDLYTVRKELGNTIETNAKSTNNWDKRMTAGLERGLQGVIDNAIVGSGGTAWPAYLQQYKNASKGIDAMQLGQSVTQNAIEPLTERLSPAKFARQIGNNEEDIAAAGARASDVLTRVNEDLKRSVAPLNAMRTAGSDTTQNLVGAQMLQRLFGSGAMSGTPGRLAGRAIGWLYSPLEQQTQQLLLNGLLDPQVGAAMLRRPIPQKPDLTAGLLAQMLPISYGGLLGTMSAQ